MGCNFCREVDYLTEKFDILQHKGSDKGSKYSTPIVALAVMCTIEDQLAHLHYQHKCKCDNKKTINISQLGVEKYIEKGR